MDAVNELMAEDDVEVPSSCGRGSWCGACVLNVVSGKVGQPEEDDTAISHMEEEEPNTMEEKELNSEIQVLSCACSIFMDAEVELPGEDKVEY